MDIERPVIDTTHGKPRLHMFCPEERIPREIFWAGFGFQVWCQMLTHIIQSQDTALFLIDEPDIYLHSELQRQLIGLLRDMGPDILIATHSTEIITEAETDDIVLINKQRNSGRRIKQPSQLEEVFSILGSNLNPVLSQAILEEFEQLWSSEQVRLAIIPGKEALSALNGHLQEKFGVNITTTAVVDAMTSSEIPKEIKLLVADLAVFSSERVVEVD